MGSITLEKPESVLVEAQRTYFRFLSANIQLPDKSYELSPSISGLVSMFRGWRDAPTYLCLGVDDRVLFSKAAKRGNDIYIRHVKNQIDGFCDIFDDVGLTSAVSTRCVGGYPVKKYVTNSLFLTLTVDPKQIISLMESDPLLKVSCYRSISDEAEIKTYIISSSYLLESDFKSKKKRFMKFLKSDDYKFYVDCNTNPSLMIADFDNYKRVYEKYHSLYVELQFENATVEVPDGPGATKYITCEVPVKGDVTQLSYAWIAVERYYNCFIAAFRKKYGKTFVIRVPESHKSGFPHYHLFIITETEFPVKFYKSKKKRMIIDASRNTQNRADISGMWALGFVDFKGVAADKSKSIKGYIFKDLLKSYLRSSKKRTAQDDQTLALNWLFNKRSFSISGIKSLDWAISRMDDLSDAVPFMNEVDVNKDIIKKIVGGKSYTFLGCFNVMSGKVLLPDFFIISSGAFAPLDDSVCVEKPDSFSRGSIKNYVD